MTEPRTPPTRDEVTAVYVALGAVVEILEGAARIVRDPDFMWECIEILEEMARYVESDDPNVNAHVRLAADAVAALHALHAQQMATLVDEAIDQILGDN